MSDLNVDEIRDAAATGAPGFPEGVKIPESGSAITDLASGTYAPSVTSVANLDGTPTMTANALFTRVGDNVTVSGQINADPTSSGVDTSFRISLPVVSNFSSDGECCGTFHRAGSQTGPDGGGIEADTSNNEALFNFGPSVTSNQEYSFIFQYVVI